MLISEALELFVMARAGVVSDATLQWYRVRVSSLARFLGDPSIDAVTLGDLRRWRAGLLSRRERWSDHPGHGVVAGGLSRATVHGHVRAARAFFGWLMREGLLGADPAKGLEVPRLGRGPRKDISVGDAVRILAAAAGHVRDCAMLRFLADTGCRLAGVAGLRIDALDLERGGAVVVEKGDRGRRVWFGSETSWALARWLVERPVCRWEVVFVTLQAGREPRPLSGNGVYQVVERWARVAGVSGRWNPHAWRHAFAHGLLDRGADLGAVSQLLGHSSVVVTVQFYGQRDDARLGEIHAERSWLRQLESTPRDS